MKRPPSFVLNTYLSQPLPYQRRGLLGGTIFEQLPERFKKELGIDGDYNPTKSNGGRNQEQTEVGLLQSKIVGFEKCGGENLFSDTAFSKDKDLR